MTRVTTHRQMCRSPDVVLTVSSSAWRYLASKMDTDEDYLVLSLFDGDWIVSIKPRKFTRIPGDALKTRLGEYTILVTHAADYKKLHGHKLQHEGGMLSVV